uniref:Uncharacterized protein n=1 Tax=Pseudomonas phage RVTF4 TaxID=3236931 RepID=A0AB39CD91_9VIRU
MQAYYIDKPSKPNPRNATDYGLRHNRVAWLMGRFASIKLSQGIIWEDQKKLTDLIASEFNSVKPVFEWRGIQSTEQLYLSIEFDEVVVMLSKGFRVGYDEATDIYGAAGNRFEVEVNKTKEGVFIQNTDQVLNEEWFLKLVTVLIHVTGPLTERCLFQICRPTA